MNESFEILIVDESQFERNILTNFLLTKNFHFVSVDSGEHCTEQIKIKKPSIVLLDIEMPKLNGKEVLAHIRKSYNSIELPVIMVTVTSKASTVVELLFLGANDYLTKPLEFDFALMRIITQLKIGILSKEMTRLKEYEVITTMIATYNHEINNPLAIAIGSLSSCKKNHDQESFDKLEKALWRVADIVRKIDGVSSKDDVDYDNYGEDLKKIKLK